MATKSTGNYDSLRKSTDYRGFLRAYLKERSLSNSDFARASGFGRGFPGDVLAGKRRLTPKSCFAFEKALKIPAPARKLFRLLVALEEKDISPEIDRALLPQMIRDLRSKPWSTKRNNLSESAALSISQALENDSILRTYAAAGEPATGAARHEIQNRTQLPESDLAASLAALEKLGLLTRNGERYFPKEMHLFLHTASKSRLLTTLFQRACKTAAERVAVANESKAEMFFTSTFCVNEESMPELKNALRETILKFVDNSMHPNGSRVVQMLTSLHF